MSIKTFFLKKVMKAKGASEEQIEMAVKIMEKDPGLFEKIFKEIEQKKKEGKSETAAAMEVMRKHQGEIQKLMQ
jgi:hypothetical protein